MTRALPLVKRALKVLVDREVTPQLGLLKSTLLQLDSDLLRARLRRKHFPRLHGEDREDGGRHAPSLRPEHARRPHGGRSRVGCVNRWHSRARSRGDRRERPGRRASALGEARSGSCPGSRSGAGSCPACPGSLSASRPATTLALVRPAGEASTYGQSMRVSTNAPGVSPPSSSCCARASARAS